jgi:plasmid stabilization system protein ParE
MKVVWGRRAKLDLRELTAYIAEDSVQGAELVAERILKAAELLNQFRVVGGLDESEEPANGSFKGPHTFLLTGSFPGGSAFSVSITGPEDGPRASDFCRRGPPSQHPIRRSQS